MLLAKLVRNHYGNDCQNGRHYTYLLCAVCFARIRFNLNVTKAIETIPHMGDMSQAQVVKHLNAIIQYTVSFCRPSSPHIHTPVARLFLFICTLRTLIHSAMVHITQNSVALMGRMKENKTRVHINVADHCNISSAMALRVARAYTPRWPALLRIDTQKRYTRCFVWDQVGI